MAEYEATVYYEAADDDVANELFNDICTKGLGCADNDPDHKCPHFRLGFGPNEIKDSRRAAFRRIRRELGYAFRLAVTGRS